MGDIIKIGAHHAAVQQFAIYVASVVGALRPGVLEEIREKAGETLRVDGEAEFTDEALSHLDRLVDQAKRVSGVHPRE